MQTTSFSLGEMLRRIKEKSLTIPQFQRSFTWKEVQVRLLVDSLARSYPIGSLLLLTKMPNFPLDSREIEAVIRDGFPPDDQLADTENKSAEIFYILDGQQRTTAIARVFLNAHPNKIYYFDLKKLYESYKSEETTWISMRARDKNVQDRKENGRLLRSDLIFDTKKVGVFVSEYFEDSGDFPNLDRSAAREAAALIGEVFESIRNYRVPVVVLERNTGIESVCRVFETINSTGTRLTTFDLAVARFFPEPDLRRLWLDTGEDHPILRDFEVDGERVLQVLHLMRAARENKYAEATRSDLLTLPKDAITQDWALAAKMLANAYAWAREQGARVRTLPNHGVLVALAAYNGWASGQGVRMRDGEAAMLRRWYFCKVLQSGNRQATNYKIGQDFSALVKYRQDGTVPSFEQVRLDRNSVVNLRAGDVRYKALQNLLATTIRHDMVTGGMIVHDSNVHDHHIFPKAASKKHALPQRELDSICNRISILGQTNIRLNEAYPDKYLESMRTGEKANGTLEGFSRRMTDCLIPGDVFDEHWASTMKLECFGAFCHERADLILRRVREVVGDSLVASELTADEEAEEDDVV
jgi:hypothetical protein